MWNDIICLCNTIHESMHRIASFYATGQDTAYVQIISAEPIAHPFPIFPYLYVGVRRGQGCRRAILFWVQTVLDLESHLFCTFYLQQPAFPLLMFYCHIDALGYYFESGSMWSSTSVMTPASSLAVVILVYVCCIHRISFQTYIKWRQPGLWVCVYLYCLVDFIFVFIIVGVVSRSQGFYAGAVQRTKNSHFIFRSYKSILTLKII